MITITFSDGTTADVQKLGLFELDHLKPDPMGPFTYKTEILGKEYDVEFDITRFDEHPQQPDTPQEELDENDPLHHRWKEYNLYLAALEHERKRRRQMVDFINSVVDYIIGKHEELVPHIKTKDDWEKLYEVLLVEPVTAELLTRILRETYAAHFEGQDIFDAMSEFAEDTGGQYDNIRLWENQLMIEMKMTEIEYVLLDVKERARKMCAMFLPKIMESLEYYQKRAKERKKDGNKGKAN